MVIIVVGVQKRGIFTLHPNDLVDGADAGKGCHQADLDRFVGCGDHFHDEVP